ncbi:hypothetical protein V2J09_021406 [Rumex salicifolius]
MEGRGFAPTLVTLTVIRSLHFCRPVPRPSPSTVLILFPCRLALSSLTGAVDLALSFPRLSRQPRPLLPCRSRRPRPLRLAHDLGALFMAGRNHVAARDAYFERHGYVIERPIIRGHDMLRPLHPDLALLEEELDIRHAEIQRLLAENRRLVEDRITLERDVGGSNEEIHRLNYIMSDVRAEGELRMRVLIQNGMKLEADLQAIEHMKSESVQLQNVVQKLNKSQQDLAGKVLTLKKDLSRLRSDSKQIPLLNSDAGGLNKELLHYRTAIDYEKKANVQLSEQKQTMENNLVSMACEAENLRAALESADGRSWSSGMFLYFGN